MQHTRYPEYMALPTLCAGVRERLCGRMYSQGIWEPGKPEKGSAALPVSAYARAQALTLQPLFQIALSAFSSYPQMSSAGLDRVACMSHCCALPAESCPFCP